MKIAIVNLSDIDELQYTINFLKVIEENIIDANIDLFVEKEVANKITIKEDYITIIPLEMKKISIFDMKIKLDNLLYYGKTAYDIAIDTQGTLKTAIITYILSGRTAGFKLRNIATLFYDEKINISNEKNKKNQVEKLLSEPFGI